MVLYEFGVSANKTDTHFYENHVLMHRRELLSLRNYENIGR